MAVLSRYLRRRKPSRPVPAGAGSRLDPAALNRRLRSGIKSPNAGNIFSLIYIITVHKTNTFLLLFLDALGDFQSSSPVPLRPYRTRSASVNSDRYSVSEVGGDSKSTPQLLGTMGEFLSV